MPDTGSCFADSAGIIREVKTGHTILLQDDRVIEVHLILSGLVEVQSRVAGQSVPIGLRDRGWALGSLAAVLGTRQLDSATALRDCVIRTIAVAEFHRVRHVDHRCGLWLQNMHAREAEDRHRRLEVWLVSSCEDRLDHLLVELFALAGEDRRDGSIRLAMPLEVQKLGDLAVMKRETASRHVGKRISGGTLEKHNGWFVVPLGSDLIDRIRAERARRARAWESGPA